MNDAAPKAAARSWIGLAVLVLPLLLITIDGTVLILGLPAISAELSPTGVEQLWMIDIYSLVLASLLVAMSTVGDRFGRRRNLLIGAVVFAIDMVGFLARRNVIVMFLCAEMMLQGVSLTLVALSRYHNDWGGQMLVHFIITVAACEAATKPRAASRSRAAASPSCI